MLIGPISQILTMDHLPARGAIADHELQIIRDGGIELDGSNIVAVGDFETMRKGFKAKVHSVAYPCVALPGFVDAHTHLCFAGSRVDDYALRVSGGTYEQIAAAGGGILDTVRKTREAPKELLVDLLMKRTALLLQNGVTTCEVKSGYGLSVDQEIKQLEAIQIVSKRQPVSLIPTCLAAHTLPWEFSDRSDYLAFLVSELLPLLKQRGLASRIDIFVDTLAFSVDEARAYLTEAQYLGFNITIHADQFSRGGALLGAELGALSVDHLEVTTLEEARILARTQVVPVVLPGATLGLGLPFAPARMLLDAGLQLAIASDWNPGSAPMGDLLTQAALLGAAQKLTIAETLAAITQRAANALGLVDRGVIKQGCRADLVLFPCSDYREILYHQGAMKPCGCFAGGQWA